MEDTNILKTEIKNTYFNLKVEQLDFIPIRENVLVKRYKFTNENTIDLNLNFLIHSKLLSNENNFVGARVLKRGMMQYTHDYTLAITSKNEKIYAHQLNDTQANIRNWGNTR